MDRSEQLLAAVRESGFSYPGGLIHLLVGGSELHRAKVKKTDLPESVGKAKISAPVSRVYLEHWPG